MKRLLSTLFCLLLAVAAFAQNANGHLKFMGIPITGTIAQFQTKLVSKGCTYDKIVSSSIPAGTRAFKGTFAGTKVRIYAFYDVQTEIVYRVKAVVDGVSEDRAEQEYNKFKNLLSQKYGTEYTQTDTKDGKERISFLATRPDVGEINFEMLSSLSQVAYGTIDVFITQDEEAWVRSPYNYNVHIDYNDQLNKERNTDNILDDL